jgi:elongator complex protein 2
MSLSFEFASGACNTSGATTCVWLLPRDEDAGRSIVAFPMHNLVSITSTHRVSQTSNGTSEVLSDAEVVCTLRGHNGVVNGLCYSEIDDVGSELYSISGDGTLKIWRRLYGSSLVDWTLVTTLESKDKLQSSLINISSLHTNQCTFLVASDSGGCVMVWKKEKNTENYREYSFLSMPPSQIPHSLQLFCMNDEDTTINNEYSTAYNTKKVNKDTQVLLLLGSVDSKIHVYLCNDDSDNNETVNSLQSVGTLIGHEEWVTSLSATRINKNTTLIASGSKDFKVRVWKFQCVIGSSINVTHASLASTNIDDDEDEVNLEDNKDDKEVSSPIVDDEVLNANEARLTFTTDRSSFTFTDTASMQYSVHLETLLQGHEDWISSVHWLPTLTCSSSKVYLISTSMDRNIILWESGSDDLTFIEMHRTKEENKSKDKNNSTKLSMSVWNPLVRIGDVGGMLGGSVGGNLLGFTSACVSSDGKAILGIGYGGSFHLYCQIAKEDEGTEERQIQTDMNRLQEHSSKWVATPFLSGHFASVNDICWKDSGKYFMSISADQTCRLFAPLAQQQQQREEHHLWKEISRPQIHGYDLSCLAMAPGDSYLLYSAGDEKMIRILDAPSLVLDGLTSLCDISTTMSPSNATTSVTEGGTGRVTRAYIPELGLSNKPADMMNGEEKANAEARRVAALDWKRAPLEGQLSDYTVWPEISSLYGHSNDIVCMDICASPSHPINLLATACKARNANTARILLWDLQKLVCVGQLQGHESTVSCLHFSACGNYLASSGKDRSLCIYDRQPSSSANPFAQYALQRGAHKRIIWDCCWSDVDTHSQCYLLCTASRDGTVKVWCILGQIALEERQIIEGSEGLGPCDRHGNPVLQCLHSLNPFDTAAVTAIQCGPILNTHDSIRDFVVALGSEKGNIQVWKITSDIQQNGEKMECSVDSTVMDMVGDKYCHGAAVKRLRWQPQSTSNDSLLLASCSEDTSVRLFRVKLSTP